MVLIAVAFLTQVGCAATPLSLADGPREYVASDYSEVLKRWTRSHSLIALSELDGLLMTSATYESWDFRWAYVVRYSRDFLLTVDQRRTLLDNTLRDARDVHEFYVAVAGQTRRWADLARPSSAWVVRLVDDQGDETAPLAIEPILKPSAIDRAYFPYSSVWRQSFRIRFARETPNGIPTISPKARWFGLRFAGAQGNDELRWDIEPGTAVAALK